VQGSPGPGPQRPPAAPPHWGPGPTGMPPGGPPHVGAPSIGAPAGAIWRAGPPSAGPPSAGLPAAGPARPAEALPPGATVPLVGPMSGPPTRTPDRAVGPAAPSLTARAREGTSRRPPVTPVLAPPGPSADQAPLLERTADARLARVHLRGGLLPLARAALEQMAGAGTLDRDALCDLAEVRWRSGDLEGAAEAASAHHASGGQEPLAALILAEDLRRIGHRDEARRLAAAVFERVAASVDILFAAEPRSDLWPAQDDGWMDLDAAAPGRWGLLVGGSEVAAPQATTWVLAPMREPVGASEPATAGQAGSVILPVGRGGPDRPGGRRSTTAIVMSGRLAGEELDAVDRTLAEGRIAAAAERLGVLLRLDPALAPVILSSADKAVSMASPGSGGLSALHLVRGDAYRILGRDIEAADAYQLAHQALASGPASKEPT